MATADVTSVGDERSKDRSAIEADPITTEVIRHGLNAAAEQMKVALRRTAFSPIIYEVHDFACALYDRQIRLLAQAQSLPIFLGTLSFCVESCVRAVGGEEMLEPGDVIFTTYGYDIGSHQQDAAVVVPAFTDGKLLGYAAIKAHHLDIGAKDPYCTDTIDIFQEGAIFPGVRLYRRGELQEDLYRTVVANSRFPQALAGDLNAQISAAKTGLAAVGRLVDRYGLSTFEACVERMFDHGEAVIRQFFEAIPDGRYVGQGAMDSNGIDDDLIPFEIALEVKGSNVVVDFSSVPEEQRGPVNSPLASTVSAARMAVMSLAGGGELPNEGHFRPVEVRVREGSMFHPIPPAPIYLYFWAAIQAVDVIHNSMAASMPERARARSGGDICCLVWWGKDASGKMWSDASNHPVGQGATYDGDGGAPLMHIGSSWIRNSPAETWEARHGIMVDQYELASDSGGAGRFRGGLGISAHYRALRDCYFTSTIERTKTPPWGLEGGKPGEANWIQVRYPDGSVKRFNKATGFQLPAGAVVEMLMGGGGGYGPPEDRDREAVHEDIRADYVTEEQARRDYPRAFSD